jgi:electron transport complex protein RnfG
MKIPENIRYIITLALICFATASLLSGVYFLTRPKILQQKQKAQEEALKEVVPSAEYFEPITEDNKVIYFKAYASSDKRKLLGYAFKTEAQGYSSTIEAMAGMDTKGKISGIKILAQNETPGLGAKINEVLVAKTLWQAIGEYFSSEKRKDQISAEPWFCAQFKGKNIEDLVVVKTQTDKNIQAITGATISSEGLTDSVREKAKEILILRQAQD